MDCVERHFGSCWRLRGVCGLDYEADVSSYTYTTQDWEYGLCETAAPLG